MPGYREHCKVETRPGPVEVNPGIVQVPADVNIVNPGAVLDDARKALPHIRVLADYWKYILEARKALAKGQASRARLEEDLRSQSASMRQHLLSLSSAALRMADHLDATGRTRVAFDNFNKFIEKKGSAKSADIYKELVGSDNLKETIADLGVDAKDLLSATDMLATLDQTIEYSNGLRISTAKQKHWATVLPPGESRVKRSLVDRILSPSLTEIANHIHELGAIQAEVVPDPTAAKTPKPIDPLVALGASAVAAVKGFDASMRRFDEVGLEYVEGQNPLTAILVGVLIAGAAAILIGGTIAILCLAGSITNSSTCEVGMVLLMFGIVLFAGSLDCLIEGCTIILALILFGGSAPVVGVGIALTGAI